MTDPVFPRGTMPTLHQWEIYSSASQGLGREREPLVKYIDRQVQSYWDAVAATRRERSFAWEMALALSRILFATDVWMRSASGTYGGGQAGKSSTLGMRVEPARAKAVRWLFDETLRQLQRCWGTSSVDETVKTLENIQLKRIEKDKEAEDLRKIEKKGMQLHLQQVEDVEKYRVLFEQKKAYVHPLFTGPPGDPLTWVAADTTSRDFQNHDNTVMAPFHHKADRSLKASLFNYGLAGFSLTLSRCFYLRPHSGGFYHSAYTCGEKVVCTGSVQFVNGDPTVLTNQSGHYKPGPEQVTYVLDLFEMVGLDTSQLKFLLTHDESSSAGLDVRTYRAKMLDRQTIQASGIGRAFGKKGRTVGGEKFLAGTYKSGRAKEGAW